MLCILTRACFAVVTDVDAAPVFKYSVWKRLCGRHENFLCASNWKQRWNHAFDLQREGKKKNQAPKQALQQWYENIWTGDYNFGAEFFFPSSHPQLQHYPGGELIPLLPSRAMQTKHQENELGKRAGLGVWVLQGECELSKNASGLCSPAHGSHKDNAFVCWTHSMQGRQSGSQQIYFFFSPEHFTVKQDLTSDVCTAHQAFWGWGCLFTPVLSQYLTLSSKPSESTSWSFLIIYFFKANQPLKRLVVPEFWMYHSGEIPTSTFSVWQEKYSLNCLVWWKLPHPFSSLLKPVSGKEQTLSWGLRFGAATGLLVWNGFSLMQL